MNHLSNCSYAYFYRSHSFALYILIDGYNTRICLNIACVIASPHSQWKIRRKFTLNFKRETCVPGQMLWRNNRLRTILSRSTRNERAHSRCPSRPVRIASCVCIADDQKNARRRYENIIRNNFQGAHDYLIVLKLENPCIFGTLFLIVFLSHPKPHHDAIRERYLEQQTYVEVECGVNRRADNTKYIFRMLSDSRKQITIKL